MPWQFFDVLVYVLKVAQSIIFAKNAYPLA
jgi:hypothetical protein